MKLLREILLLSSIAALAAAVEAAPGIVPVGAGSYAIGTPPGAKGPPAMIYKTGNVRGPVPTSDWWSSLVAQKFSERHYAHPLAVQFGSNGLRVFYPTVTASANGIFAAMPGAKGEDLLIGHAVQAGFPDARVDGFSDWFVTAQQADGANKLTFSYGHGSPFIYAQCEGGGARIAFPQVPLVWSGSAQSAALGVTIRGKHYGLFGPTGSTWAGLGGSALTNLLAGKNYFSIALLPDNAPETFALFARHAHAHVVDTRVAWRYEAAGSSVVTEYRFTTVAREGAETGTLFALYPHQWTRATTPLLGATYHSVRGVMKLAAGNSFTTTALFPGVLPALPDGGVDKAKLDGLLDAEVAALKPKSADTYWEGKLLGKLASLVPLAEQSGHKTAGAAFTKDLKRRLENWFTATDTNGVPKSKTLFCLNTNWGTLIGYPASYGSDTELSDHHFHYGYFIRAAAEIARRDKAWAADARWGAMVKLLIRDTACPDRDDKLFPFLRNFDPYAGHSWASGLSIFADGNNNESSSEAMNAWTGLILWGEATGDTRTRDLGIYLFTTEMDAINAYWFDVQGQFRSPKYTASVVTMVWGGKGVNETWFTRKPEAVHGINFLPMHGGSLYLGLYPDYVKKNYDALVAETSGKPFDQWTDIAWMYRALQDPEDALRQWNSADGKFAKEDGNSAANTYHWIQTLAVLGQVDRTVTADVPTYAVFRKGGRKTYTAYNYGDQPRLVKFSDGPKMTLAPNSAGMISVGP